MDGLTEIKSPADSTSAAEPYLTPPGRGLTTAGLRARRAEPRASPAANGALQTEIGVMQTAV